ncbi:MAG: hypothetical protein RLZZ253_2059, partial [Verrucomicrobiota bacterium]
WVCDALGKPPSQPGARFHQEHPIPGAAGCQSGTDASWSCPIDKHIVLGSHGRKARQPEDGGKCKEEEGAPKSAEFVFDALAVAPASLGFL